MPLSPLATGLMPGNDIEKAKADIFSEAIYDLENAFIRAVADPDKNQQVKHDYHHHHHHHHHRHHHHYYYYFLLYFYTIIQHNSRAHS